VNLIPIALFLLVNHGLSLDMSPVSVWTNGPALTKALAQVNTPLPPPIKHPKLIWDWIPDGAPVFFEVWHTNRLPSTLTIIGTNVPIGFTMFTNVLSPSTDIGLDQVNEFFIVRAGNSIGYSDWNSK
jgi:hypothetical protein